MSEKHKLTEGALKIILNGGEVENPLMQVLGSKKIAMNKADNERYRILLSDGKFLFSFAILTTTQCNNDKMISVEDIENNSIICLKRYVTSVISNFGPGSGKSILVILDMDVVVSGKEVGHKIGNPKHLPDSDEDESKNETPSTNENREDEQPPPAKRPHLSNSNTSNSAGNLDVSTSERLTIPISSLNPYQNLWAIKARVTVKTPIRTWSNSRGEGKLFSMTLLDESGEIRATGFQQAVDKYYDLIQVDKVYCITKGQLKLANKKFNNVQNDYEMTIGNEAIIQECAEGDDLVPNLKYSFSTIDKVANMEVGAAIDVFGIVKHASDLEIFTAKSTGREFKKRELTLVDMSKTSVAVTLWGNDAESYNFVTPVAVLKNAKIGEFNGARNLSCTMDTIIKYNPDIQEAFVIRGWYDNGGDKEVVSHLSARSGGGTFQTNWMSFHDVKEQGLGNAERGDYYQVKGTVLLMRAENLYYKACATDNCYKKVIDMENGYYRCEKCNAEFPNFKYRLLGNANVGDWSGNQWISMFSTEAEAIFKKTAQEIGEAGERSESELLDIVNETNFREYIIKCRTKMETYNDETRLKTVAVKVEPVNYKEYNSYLLGQIQQLTSEIL